MVLKLMSIKKLYIFMFLLIASTCIFVNKKYFYEFRESPIVSLGLSDDGSYVVSSHENNSIILWDLTKQKANRISSNANIYSAYFIKGGHNYLWQNLNNEVFVDSVNGVRLLSFMAEPSYSHVMTSDMKQYLMADDYFHVWKYDLVNNDWSKLNGRVNRLQYFYLGKTLNMHLSKDDKYLLTAGDSGPGGKPSEVLCEFGEVVNFSSTRAFISVTLWDVDQGLPLCVYDGNSGKTHATLSPDGQYVVGGDEQGPLNFFWDAKTSALNTRLASVFSGIYILPEDRIDPEITRDRSGLIKRPDDFDSNKTIAYKYISDDYFLHFTKGTNYAVLYENNNPWPLKFLPLGKENDPMNYSYMRNNAIDTVPEINRLVMAQQYSGHILVYDFDVETLELNLVWNSADTL